MKSARQIYVSTLFLMTFVLPSCTQEWKPVRQDAGSSVFVDPSSIEKTDQLVTAKVKSQRSGQTFYMVTTYQIQCSDRTYRPVERVFYERAGVLIGQDSDETVRLSFMPVNQGSDDGIEAIYNDLCR